MKKTMLAMIIVIGAVIISGCSLYGNVPSNSNNSSTPAVKTTTNSNAINIQNFAFSPAILTVKKGTTVTWTNDDSAPHQIKSTTFNSSSLGKGQAFSFAFDTLGAFDYSCAIHPSMTGKIIVE